MLLRKAIYSYYVLPIYVNGFVDRCLAVMHTAVWHFVKPDLKCCDKIRLQNTMPSVAKEYSVCKPGLREVAMTHGVN